MSDHETANDVQVLETTPQLLYADRIINFSTGVTISKLVLGLEVAPGKYMPSVTLAIPTAALLEALPFIQSTFTANPDVKTGLIKGALLLKDQFEQL
jgi:hypothetical protein